MNRLIDISIRRPTAVMAVVLMVVAFGLIALRTIPIQLTPDVRRPVIDIRTDWPGAAPAEVEREITNRIEDELGGIEGVTELTSRSRFGNSRIRLEFEVGYNLDKAMLVIGNRLSGIDDLPDDADEPRIETRGTDDIPIASFVILRDEGNTRPLDIYGDFMEDVVIDRLQRVPGVAGADYDGGAERELRVVVKPRRLAAYGLTVPDVLKALRDASRSSSAGTVDEGKRSYLVRTEGEINTPARARAVVLRREADDGSGRVGRVTVGDVADVSFAYKERKSYRSYLGEETITLDVYRDTGANVIKTMNGIHAAMKELNDGPLARRQLHAVQVYDATTYINAAIGLVRENIWEGGALAAMMLLLFLRSWRPILVVTLSIPVSVIGSFVAMAALGRSLNVISLAGIAFAVGMVVDAAIVVLENIFRHREMGKPPVKATLEATREVWPAVFASALTTIVVFAPVLMLKMQVGQLFRDIAVALSVSVVLSLIVSVTVIPALAKHLLKEVRPQGRKPLRLPVIDDFAHGFVRVTLGFTRFVLRSKTAAAAVIVGLIGGTVVFTYVALPPLDFLPDGNRNQVWGRVTLPPGYNLETSRQAAERIEAALRPLWASVSGPDSKPGQPPKIKDFYYVARDDQIRISASAVDPLRAGELEPVIEAPILRQPGTRASVEQSSIFSRGIGGSRNIHFDISGPNLDHNLSVARRADSLLAEVLPRSEGHRIRPRPGLELGAPEVRITPDQLRLADAGLTTTDLAETVDAFNDGVRVTDITADGHRMDLTLAGPEDLVHATQGIANLPVVTPGGRIVPASSLGNVELTAGPTQIWHLERQRYVQLSIRPSKLIPLETTIDDVRNNVVKVLEKQGIPDDVKIGLSGAADELAETWNHVKYDLLAAMLVVFLVMAVIMESFLYPFVIMLSVPLATAGGVIGLWFLNTVVLPAGDRQPLDMLTMLGFIILIGTVVNNAILLVAYTLTNVRDHGMAPAEAILDSTVTRIRPVFMSTLTTVIGMLPLVLAPGAGSELYRGLGAVVVGGLSFSAVLTLMIIPPLLSMLSWKLKREIGKNKRPDIDPPALAAE